MQYDIQQFPDRVTQGEDGVYRWKYRMNPRRNKHPLRVTGTVLLCMAAISALGLLIVGPPTRTMSVWAMPLMVAGLLLGLFLLITGLLYLQGDDMIPFAMDEETFTIFRAKGSGPHLFRRVRRVRLLPQYDAVHLGLGLTLYVPPEDYEAVKTFILDRLSPEARIK